MSYQPQSPEEQQFMADFQRNLPAINAFRAQYPKESLEGAYYKVTGKEWMPGRSVQMNGSMPEMTKDRTFKSVMGKYVAPIAAAAATPFIGPELFGLLGAGGGAGAAGTAAGTSMIGAAGAGLGIGAGTAAGITGAASAIPALTSLSGAPVTAVNAIPSITGAYTPAVGASHMAAGLPSLAGSTASIGGSGGSGAGGLLSKFMGHASDASNLADSASMLGNYAGAQANNRTEMANLGQNYDQARLQSQQDQRTNESDAMHKLASSGYIMGGGSKYTHPSALSLGGQNYSVPNLGLGPTSVTDTEKAGATTLQEQMLKRLQPGGSVQPTDPSQYAHQGAGEKAANAGSLILGGLGAYRSIFGK